MDDLLGYLSGALAVFLLALVVRAQNRRRRQELRGGPSHRDGPYGPWFGPDDGDSNDREPRRPRPYAGAGAAALPLPDEEEIDRAG